MSRRLYDGRRCAFPPYGAAIALTLDALEHIDIDGVKTTVPFHRFALAHPDFRAMRVSTRWIESTGMAQYQAHRSARL